MEGMDKNKRKMADIRKIVVFLPIVYSSARSCSFSIMRLEFLNLSFKMESLGGLAKVRFRIAQLTA